MNNISFSDFSAYRRTMHPILEQRRLLRGNEPSYNEESNMPKSPSPAWLFWPLVLIICVFMIHGCEAPAHAYTEQEVVKTIVGEASNQGYIGMVAVAEVIRHTDSLRGFYGYHASHSAYEPKWVWNMARKAWIASLRTNYTGRADHFENIHAFGRPYWVKNCVETFVYRDHVFYREIV